MAAKVHSKYADPEEDAHAQAFVRSEAGSS